MIEVEVIKPRIYDDADTPKLAINDTEMPTREGAFFMSLVERWGMVGARDDGEDSAGRARIGEASIDHVIERAAKMASRTFDEMRKNNNMFILPTIAEQKEAIMEQKEERKRLKAEQELLEEETHS